MAFDNLTTYFVLLNKMGVGYSIVLNRVTIMKRKDFSRDAVTTLLLSLDTQYHLTITYSKYTSKEACRSVLNTFFNRLNAKIYKQRFKDGIAFLTGIAIQERSVAMDTFHFHILIEKSDYLPSIDRMNQLVKYQVNYFRRSTAKNTICDYLLQPYFNDGDNKLEHYLTKQFESITRPMDYTLKNMGVLTGSGVYF
jgi:hypothetical protein